MSSSPENQVGRVTGTIEPGQVGEVMISIRGGSEAFFAYSEEAEMVIPIGRMVLVTRYLPPRSVLVVPYG